MFPGVSRWCRATSGVPFGKRCSQQDLAVTGCLLISRGAGGVGLEHRMKQGTWEHVHIRFRSLAVMAGGDRVGGKDDNRPSKNEVFSESKPGKPATGRADLWETADGLPLSLHRLLCYLCK